MIYISHRGNLNGRIPDRENSPAYVDEAIAAGFEVEVDLRVVDGIFYLGHLGPEHIIDDDWLYQRKNKLWLHLKNYDAVYEMSKLNGFKYFCNQKDDFSMFSNGYILYWNRDPNDSPNEKCLVPLETLEQVETYTKTGFGGIISNHIIKCKEKFK